MQAEFRETLQNLDSVPEQWKYMFLLQQTLWNARAHFRFMPGVPHPILRALYAAPLAVEDTHPKDLLAVWCEIMTPEEWLQSDDWHVFYGALQSFRKQMHEDPDGFVKLTAEITSDQHDLDLWAIELLQKRDDNRAWLVEHDAWVQQLIDEELERDRERQRVREHAEFVASGQVNLIVDDVEASCDGWCKFYPICQRMNASSAKRRCTAYHPPGNEPAYCKAFFMSEEGCHFGINCDIKHHVTDAAKKYFGGQTNWFVPDNEEDWTAEIREIVADSRIASKWVEPKLDMVRVEAVKAHHAARQTVPVGRIFMPGYNAAADPLAQPLHKTKTDDTAQRYAHVKVTQHCLKAMGGDPRSFLPRGLGPELEQELIDAVAQELLDEDEEIVREELALWGTKRTAGLLAPTPKRQRTGSDPSMIFVLKSVNDMIDEDLKHELKLKEQMALKRKRGIKRRIKTARVAGRRIPKRPCITKVSSGQEQEEMILPVKHLSADNYKLARMGAAPARQAHKRKRDRLDDGEEEQGPAKETCRLSFREYFAAEEKAEEEAEKEKWRAIGEEAHREKWRVAQVQSRQDWVHYERPDEQWIPPSAEDVPEVVTFAEGYDFDHGASLGLTETIDGKATRGPNEWFDDSEPFYSLARDGPTPTLGRGPAYFIAKYSTMANHAAGAASGGPSAASTPPPVAPSKNGTNSSTNSSKSAVESTKAPEVGESTVPGTSSKKRGRDEDKEEEVDKPTTKKVRGAEEDTKAASDAGNDSFASRTPSPHRLATDSLRVSRSSSATSTGTSSCGTPPPATKEAKTAAKKGSSVAPKKDDDTKAFPEMATPPFGRCMTEGEFNQRKAKISKLKAEGAASDDERRRYRNELAMRVKTYGVDVEDPAARKKLYVANLKEENYPRLDNCWDAGD